MRVAVTKAILDSVKKTYDSIAEDFSKTRNHAWDEFKVFKKYIKSGDFIVDVGCGNGRFYKFLSEKRKDKPIYLGLDTSKKLLKEAKKLNPKATFKVGNLIKLPLKDDSSDVTVCIAAIHHIPSKSLRKIAVYELSRITKPNGKLILSVWNLREQKKYRKHRFDAFVRYLLTRGSYEKRGLLIPWGKEKLPRYYYAFKAKEIEKLLKTHFKIIKKSKDKNLTYICEKL